MIGNLKYFSESEIKKLMLRTNELRGQGLTIKKIAERFGMTYDQLRKVIEKHKGDKQCITM